MIKSIQITKNISLPINLVDSCREVLSGFAFRRLHYTMLLIKEDEWTEKDTEASWRGSLTWGSHLPLEKWAINLRRDSSTMWGDLVHEWGHAVWYNLELNHPEASWPLRDRFIEWWYEEGGWLGSYGASSKEEGWAEAVRQYFMYCQDEGPVGLGPIISPECNAAPNDIYSPEWERGMDIVEEILEKYFKLVG